MSSRLRGTIRRKFFCKWCAKEIGVMASYCSHFCKMTWYECYSDDPVARDYLKKLTLKQKTFFD